MEAAFKLRNVAFRFSGMVEWTDEKHEVDVRFTDLTPRRMEELVEVLCEQAAENAAKAIKKAAERLAAREKARKEAEARPTAHPVAAPTAAKGPAENSPTPVGASKAALRAALQPAAKLPELATRLPAAPVESNRPSVPPLPAVSLAGRPQPLAPVTEAAKPPEKAAHGERRKQSRQQVDAWATIHLVNIASRLRGRILNLSLGGCSIRTEKCFPVGIYTRVEAEFHFEGLPFRLGGVVQALPDRKNVGIRFLDMSERKREQVERLMAEIAQSRERQESIGTSTSREDALLA